MKDTAIAFVVGLVIGFAAMWYISGKEYAPLKAYADSTARSSNLDKIRAHEYSDSMENLVRLLQEVKAPIVLRVHNDSAQVAAADAALKIAKTMRDSNVVLVREVEDLKSQVTDLHGIISLDFLQVMDERRRGDSLLAKIDTLNLRVQSLTQRVDAVHGTPKWLSVSFDIVKIGAAGYIGYRIGRKHG